MASGDLTLWEGLDRELTSMVEHFSNLLRASRVPDEEADTTAAREGRKDRAPGDLLGVWADKLTYSGYTALHLTSQLKRSALLADFESLMTGVRNVRGTMGQEAQHVDMRLASMRSDMQSVLLELEESYYSSPHRGPLPPCTTSVELKELAALALEMPERPPPLASLEGATDIADKAA